MVHPTGAESCFQGCHCSQGGTQRRGSHVRQNLPDRQSKPEIPENLWKEFTPAIKSVIIKEYIRIKGIPADGDFADNEIVLWTTSILSSIRAMPSVAPSSTVEKPGSWLRDNITGLMLVAGLLTVAFGVLTAWGLSASTTAKDATSGFLDIAKLFAGALVGAAGAAGIGAAAAEK